MEIYYGMGMVAKFLGISRQQARNRMEKEEWPCKLDEDGVLIEPLRIPSSSIKKSRDLERQKLTQRVDKLDALTTQQNMSDTMETIKQEQGL